MGSQVIAACKCGANAIILIGGGMFNFMETCYFPCMCKGCHEVVQANLLAKEARCPQCRARNPIPYDDPRLLGEPGSYHVAEWRMTDKLDRDLVLTDGKYMCPKCGKMSLGFRDSGLCWD